MPSRLMTDEEKQKMLAIMHADPSLTEREREAQTRWCQQPLYATPMAEITSEQFAAAVKSEVTRRQAGR